jgi:hypothetical protein
MLAACEFTLHSGACRYAAAKRKFWRQRRLEVHVVVQFLNLCEQLCVETFGDWGDMDSQQLVWGRSSSASVASSSNSCWRQQHQQPHKESHHTWWRCRKGWQEAGPGHNKLLLFVFLRGPSNPCHQQTKSQTHRQEG